MVENWNSANSSILYGKGGEVASNRLADQELSVLALHLLQISMVYVNTLMIQNLLGHPDWSGRLGEVDRRALSPLLYAHINPYGQIELDMANRLRLAGVINQRKENVGFSYHAAEMACPDGDRGYLALRNPVNISMPKYGKKRTAFLTARIGYARVSTDDQELSLQRDALADCDRIFEDKATGVSTERSGLRSALDYARAGDVIVVWRLDRLSRSLKDLIEMVGNLEERSIGLQSIHESIDTTSSVGKLVFHIFGALAEFERNLIRERTQAGLKSARARGRLGGRPKALDRSKRELAVKLYKERNHTVSEICNLMGVSRPTLYSYVKEARNG